MKCYLLSLRWCWWLLFIESLLKNSVRTRIFLIDEESDVHCFQWQSVLAIHSSIFRSLGRQKETQLQWQTLQWQFRVINQWPWRETGWSGVSSHRASELTHSCYRKWIPLWPIIDVMLYISQPDLTSESSAGLMAGPTGKKKHPG